MQLSKVNIYDALYIASRVVLVTCNPLDIFLQKIASNLTPHS